MWEERFGERDRSRATGRKRHRGRLRRDVTQDARRRDVSGVNKERRSFNVGKVEEVDTRVYLVYIHLKKCKIMSKNAQLQF